MVSANLTSMCCRRVTNTLAGERMSVMHTSTFATNHSRHGLTTSHYVVHTSIGVRGISLICACPEPSFLSALPSASLRQRNNALPTCMHVLYACHVSLGVLRYSHSMLSNSYRTSSLLLLSSLRMTRLLCRISPTHQHLALPDSTQTFFSPVRVTHLHNVSCILMYGNVS